MISFTEKMADKNKKYNIQAFHLADQKPPNSNIFKVPVSIPIHSVIPKPTINLRNLHQNTQLNNTPVFRPTRTFTNQYRFFQPETIRRGNESIKQSGKEVSREKDEVSNKDVDFTTTIFKLNLKNISPPINDNDDEIPDDSRKYTPIIPLKIFQTWFSKTLPEHIGKCVEELKALNPEFEHHLYDDDECRNFIRDNFDNEVLESFDLLIPGAYKADLWRYCILYIYGGIYMDIKYRCINGFRLISLSEQVGFVKDAKSSGLGIYNALLITPPRNPLYLNFINKVVYNVKNRFYGENSLCPTGPMMLKQFFNQKNIHNINLQHRVVFNSVTRENSYFIFDIHRNKNILKIDENYRNEQRLNTNNKRHYSTMWDKREIYLQGTV